MCSVAEEIVILGASATSCAAPAGGQSPPLCKAAGTANAIERGWYAKWAPQSFTKSGVVRRGLVNASSFAVTALLGEINEGRVTERKTKLTEDDVTWWRIARCVKNNGTSTRGRLFLAGYDPQPIVKTTVVEKHVPDRMRDMVPVLLDRLANPGLMFIILVVLLLVMVAIAVAEVRHRAKKRDWGRRMRRYRQK